MHTCTQVCSILSSKINAEQSSSHLLSRRGLAERIGNLVGHLKFSEDQLQQTDKGLKASGVAIPNFGNVGRELAKEINEEPEVEPETDDERMSKFSVPGLFTHFNDIFRS